MTEPTTYPYRVRHRDSIEYCATSVRADGIAESWSQQVMEPVAVDRWVDTFGGYYKTIGCWNRGEWEDNS